MDFKPDYTPDQLKELGVYDSVYGDGPQLASMEAWPKEWLDKRDPKGWLQWYDRYSQGRRIDDDERQIRRWKSFKARHGSQLAANPTPRRAQALINWGIDPIKLVPGKNRAMLKAVLAKYRQRRGANPV